MNPQLPSLKELNGRLLKLEKQNRRFKQLGIAVMIVPTLLLIMGQAASKKTIEANEFILKDSSGKVRATLSLNEEGGATKFIRPEWPSNSKYQLRRFKRFDVAGKRGWTPDRYYDVEYFGDGYTRTLRRFGPRRVHGNRRSGICGANRSDRPCYTQDWRNSQNFRSLPYSLRQGQECDLESTVAS